MNQFKELFDLSATISEHMAQKACQALNHCAGLN